MINIFKNKIASVLIIIALIVVISVFIISIIRSSKQEQIDEAKMANVDALYSIWTDVSGTGDKQTLENNKAKYTREIYDKLSDEEIEFLTEYSENFRTIKNEPSLFTPISIAMVGYLAQNFNKMKQVAAKTSLKDYLNKFGVTVANKMSTIM